jgi:hypothetical protein
MIVIETPNNQEYAKFLHLLPNGSFVDKPDEENICPCLFQLFAASGHQKPLWTAKHSAFQPASIKFI